MVKTDANANKRPIKPSPDDVRKIDGVVACIMGLAGAHRQSDNNWFTQSGGLLGRGIDAAAKQTLLQ